MSDAVTQAQPGIFQTATREAAFAIPPVTAWALTLNDIVAFASLAYIALQAAYLIWRWMRERNRPPGAV